MDRCCQQELKLLAVKVQRRAWPQAFGLKHTLRLGQARLGGGAIPSTKQDSAQATARDLRLNLTASLRNLSLIHI